MPRPSDSEIEGIEQTIGKGQRASGALKSLTPFINEMNDKWIEVLAVKGDTMTNEAMRLVVGHILGLRKLKQHLENAVTYGMAASERRDGR
jgi:hypothetical protein